MVARYNCGDKKFMLELPPLFIVTLPALMIIKGVYTANIL